MTPQPPSTGYVVVNHFINMDETIHGGIYLDEDDAHQHRDEVINILVDEHENITREDAEHNINVAWLEINQPHIKPSPQTRDERMTPPHDNIEEALPELLENLEFLATKGKYMEKKELVKVLESLAWFDNYSQQFCYDRVELLRELREEVEN